MLKSTKDDSVVFNNDSINKFLTQPNALQSFDEFVSLHFLYKFLTGNSFIKASVFSESQKSYGRDAMIIGSFHPAALIL